VPWLFFSTALMDSTNCLLSYYTLLKKTYFPREIIPLASVAGNLIHFSLSTAVFLGYLAVMSLFRWATEGSFNWPILPSVVFLPIPIIGLVLLVTGLSMFVSVWTLYFEDIRYLVDSGLKVLYWLVPVIYFSDVILWKNPKGHGELFYRLYMLNPLAALITAFRKLILPPTKMLGTDGNDFLTPPMGGNEWLFLCIALLTSTALLALGLRFFNHRKWYLAERG
jgi:ABC-2 type transport system permease protein